MYYKTRIHHAFVPNAKLALDDPQRIQNPSLYQSLRHYKPRPRTRISRGNYGVSVTTTVIIRSWLQHEICGAWNMYFPA